MIILLYESKSREAACQSFSANYFLRSAALIHDLALEYGVHRSSASKLFWLLKRHRTFDFFLRLSGYLYRLQEQELMSSSTRIHSPANLVLKAIRDRPSRSPVSVQKNSQSCYLLRICRTNGRSLDNVTILLVATNEPLIVLRGLQFSRSRVGLTTLEQVLEYRIYNHPLLPLSTKSSASFTVCLKAMPIGRPGCFGG